MIETKKPEVYLYNFTSSPLETIALPVYTWHSDDDLPVSPYEFLPTEAYELAGKALKAYHRTALEYVSFIFVIKNVSRAFQQQLTRTRMAGYSIQSLRVVSKSGFAASGRYTMPPGLDPDMQERFHNVMCLIQEQYEMFIEDGMPVEDARGILPLNIHSDITMVVNLSALSHMLNQRFCVLTQWEYRQVAAQIKELISSNVSDILTAQMDAPCVKARKCPMREEYCGTPVWQLSECERIQFYKDYVK